MTQIRMFLLRHFPQLWFPHQLKPYQFQLLLFTLAFGSSALVLLTGWGLSTGASWGLAAGSIVFLEFFCHPLLEDVAAKCGNQFDRMPEWGWAVIHVAANALIYYIIFVLLWLVLRAMRPIEGVGE